MLEQMARSLFDADLTGSKEIVSLERKFLRQGNQEWSKSIQCYLLGTILVGGIIFENNTVSIENFGTRDTGEPSFSPTRQRHSTFPEMYPLFRIRTRQVRGRGFLAKGCMYEGE